MMIHTIKLVGAYSGPYRTPAAFEARARLPAPAPLPRVVPHRDLRSACRVRANVIRVWAN
eukprot:2378270-Rhodomonas_salina.1